MNEFLKTREQVNLASQWLLDNGLEVSGLSCKNWEGATVLKELKDGDFLDMGSSGGIILDNAIILKLKGRKAGVDLAYKIYGETDVVTIKENGIELHGNDLMNTKFDNNSFDIIVCVSVIEHEVDFERFAKEVNRLLRSGGTVFVSFDYWEPKPAYEKRKLYNLDWNILDRNDVIDLVKYFSDNGMELTSEIDWTTQDAVINSTYCSPVIGVEYSFGILNFIKK